jgi:predicted transcriptional regulator
MKVLMSIKPEFAFKIFAGTKRFEFRRAVFKNKEIKTVIVYASSPVQQVIGEFEIEQILSFEPETLWKKTKKYSGISEEFFFEYFESKTVAHAIKIKSVKRYHQPLCLKSDFNVAPPQSYLYVPS